jgi:restriction system protein
VLSDGLGSKHFVNAIGKEMKNYYRVMLGKKSIYAETCFNEGFIGTDFEINQDLTNELPENWRDFNAKFRSIYLANHPGKTNVGAGLACGFLWTVSKGIKIGDVVLCPDGLGAYHVGEVIGNYHYVAGSILPNRRNVRWSSKHIQRDQMSDALKNSTGSIGTSSNITSYAAEVDSLITGEYRSPITSSDPSIENPSEFALEKHLEDFLVQNWKQTDLGKEFDIFEEDGELVGQQYQSDTGPMDILAIKKDKSKLLVVELKKGRASDAVVGQVLRYMGYVKQELAEANQSVSGVIIALDDDTRIRRALAMKPDISFYRYEVSFKLIKSA